MGDIMSIEHFLERNYINPVILKYTKFRTTKRLPGTRRCGGTCGGFYEPEYMTAIVYDSGKQILRCPDCMRKYKRRGIK